VTKFYVWGADVAHQLVATPFTTREKAERAADALTRMERPLSLFRHYKGKNAGGRRLRDGALLTLTLRSRTHGSGHEAPGFNEKDIQKCINSGQALRSRRS
jgi:hypothetical protein